jgi:chromosome segregation ATPase
MPHVDPATSTLAAKSAADAPCVERPVRAPSATYDWDRLERAVSALIAERAALRSEVDCLRLDLGERNHRIRSLEAQLLDANQRRKDTSKRIDELIAQLDQLDVQLAAVESNS